MHGIIATIQILNSIFPVRNAPRPSLQIRMRGIPEGDSFILMVGLHFNQWKGQSMFSSAVKMDDSEIARTFVCQDQF